MHNESKQRVLVIGGGPSGIIALKEFSSSQAFEVLCMEQLSAVGGLWNYSDVITQPDHPTSSFYTGIYKNLRTNVTHKVMSFTDMSYPEHLPSFVRHTDVKEYLCNYARTHKLHQYIKFNTRVKSVRPKVERGREDRWEVEWINVLSKETETSHFDIVIVCSGIHFKANLPVIKGMKDFKGELLHSQQYRDPENFRNKRVVLVGAGFSGIDISIEINKTAQKVWLCNKGSKKNIPDSIQQCKELIEFTKKGVIVRKWEDINEGKENISTESSTGNIDDIKKDGNVEKKKESDEKEMKESDVVRIEEVDLVLFCTGYDYSFPFLNADCGVSVISTGMVGPLYKDLICLGRQSLSFIGLHLHGVSLLLEYQVKFLKAFYEGKFTIPPFGKELLELVEQDAEKKRSKDVNVDEKPLCIPFYQFEYMNDLAGMAGFEKLHGRYEIHFRELEKQRQISHVNYKKIEYEIGSDGYFVEKKNHKVPELC